MSRSGSSGSRGEFREIRLPNTLPVNALIYFCGRDPRKAKSVRRYYDDASDARSTRSSNSSMWSWSSGGGQTYLVESTDPYWYWGEQTEYSTSRSSSRRQKSSRSGRNSRASQQHSQPTGTWARHATVEDDDDDDSSDDGSVAYGNQGAGPSPYPPGMMPGMSQPGPPPGAFQPVYGVPGMPQHGTTYVPAPNGVPMPPPPRNIPMPRPPSAMPRPPSGGGGGFVTDPNGIQVFTG